ncbi:MAG: MFS transporter [Polyangiaceae bacterium]|nr:MFS transporter [Polyangiaceae bacterium]
MATPEFEAQKETAPVSSPEPLISDALSDAKSSSKSLKTGSWVSSTYFAEGFPYAIVNNLAEVLFKDLGASLGAIGLTSLFHLPWNIKFLWAHWLDTYETKRRWMIVLQIILGLLLLLLSMGADSSYSLGLISCIFLALAFFSATNDIAIDGFYMEALQEREQALFVGFRAFCYRLASSLVKGPLIILIGFVGWRWGLASAAGLMFCLAAMHAALLPTREKRQRHLTEGLQKIFSRRLALRLVLLALGAFAYLSPWGVKWRTNFVESLSQVPIVGSWGASNWIAVLLLLALLVATSQLKRLAAWARGSESELGRSTVALLELPHFKRVLAFIILFRTGESFLQKMKLPFLAEVYGVSNQEYGAINGFGGVVAAMVATFWGGWMISRYGLKRCLWPFVLAQNLFNLLYLPLALAAGHLTHALWWIGGVIAVEEFGAGLGTAVFMVYLMRACDPRHKAAHFALFSALMSLSFTFAGAFSGFIAEAIGFAGYFGFTVLATVPMMLLAARVPHLEERP